MEPNLYFMLQTDSVASKLDKTTPHSNVHVNCGSIWVYHDDVTGASPQHRLRPQHSLGSNRNANSQMTLYSAEQQDVLLTCFPQDVSQIDEVEAQLLLAVPIAERQRVIRETTVLHEGRQIFQRWSDQFRVSHRNATSEIYVYVLGQKDLPERAAGVVQYVGPLPSFNGTWFGVKLAPKYHGFGTTDGFFRGKQFFQCPTDSGVFVAINKICMCSDYVDFDETYDIVQHQGRPSPLAFADRNGDVSCSGFSKGGPSCEAVDEDFPRPPLQIGERIVWISDYGPEPGTVKWIGILPDCRVKEYTIGVEFDRPIGTGTGKYNNDQLFRTAQNHASLIPVLGLMKAEEFYGSKEAVPPSPFATGSTMVKRYGTTVKTPAHSGQEYCSRHDTPSPHGPKLDHGSAAGIKGKDIKSVSDIDQVSDTLCQSDEELRPCYMKQYSKTMPRSAKSTTTSSSDTTSLLTMSSRLSDQATKGPPPVPLEKLCQETEKSIYDKEPEHYYENVEKDATGRLLNRDTNAFRMIDGGSERLTNARSNSGDDVSGMRGNRTEDSTNVAIYRSSRSVDNIFSDEKVLQNKDEQFTVQLPYRTGRSVFYERLEKASSLVNGKPAKEKQNPGSTTKKSETTKKNCDNQDVPDLTQKLSVFVSPGSSPSHSNCDSNSGHIAAKTTPRHLCRPLHSSFDSQKDVIISDRKTSAVTRGGELYSLPAKFEHLWKADNGTSTGGVTGLLTTGGSSGLGGTLQGTVGAQGVTSLPRSGGPHGTGGPTGISVLSEEEMLIPKTLSKAELETDLEIGSMVEVEIGGSIHYGVMRWIGFLRDRNKPLAGIELEEELNSATDGRLGKTRLFDCPPKKAFFVLLSSVRKDGRFEESLQFVNRTASQMFGSMECIDIAGCLPALVMSSITSSHVGLNKGIQGHHNSCYMDATLFSMFAFTMVFDSILYRPKQPGDIGQYDDIQLALREGIVNPLRSNFYVRADKVLRLRTLLDQCSTVQGLMGEEKDPEEFISSLLQQTLKADPFIHLSSGQESYLFQLFISEKDDNILLPTTQQLLELSFLQSDIKLSEIPSCLILQMPRFGKDYKMFRRIVPSLYLDITDILQFGIRECTICGALATYECKNCHQQSGDGLDKIAFCDICLGKNHKNPKRSKHQPSKIEINEGFVRFAKEHKSDGDLSMEGTREKMELFAVVCIQTSHYVAFVKCGPGPNAPWVFFDSMADRKGEQHGYNIPCVEPCAFLPQLLQDPSYTTIHKYRDEKDIPDQMRRLLCDGYMCMYQTTSLVQYR